MERAKGFIELNVSELVRADWNYKSLGDKFLLDKLKENIKRNGFIENLIVRHLGDKYEVVNGNHRLVALNELNVPTVMCYNLGEITLNQAKRISIETNETKFETDRIELSKILIDLLADFGADLELSMPYSGEEFKDLLELSQYSFDKEEIVDEDFKSPDNFKTYSFRGPSEVIYEFKSQIDRIKGLLKPGTDPEEHMDFLAIEVIAQSIKQTPSEQII